MANFIKHFKGATEKFFSDDRLTASHVSLYMALFMYWNENHFNNPVLIYRKDVLKLCKIGSANTYTKCLHDLHNWNYIRYIPTNTSMRPSQVHIFRFDNAPAANDPHRKTKPVRNDTGDDTSGVKIDNGDNTGDRKIDNDDDTSGRKIDDGDETTVIPLNKTLPNVVNIKTSLSDAHAAEGDTGASAMASGDIERVEGNFFKKISAIPKNLAEVQVFFAKLGGSDVEGRKFFNYYASKGWKIGRDAPMENWKASADTWMINARAKAATTPSAKTTYLHTTTIKNYEEPI